MKHSTEFLFTVKGIFVFATILVASPLFLSGQGLITGIVLDNETGMPISGANVVVENTYFGAATAEDGSFSIDVGARSPVVLVVSAIGYESIRTQIFGPEAVVPLRFELRRRPLWAPEITITATRARIGETPVTASNLSRQDLEERGGMKDFPVLLSELPSTTFYSENGNGIGYSYLSIRGFRQRRISVLINGIPQNDPEDHNVYWINFYDLIGSLADIQVQRGAGSAFYGPAAIGGSINLVTKQYRPEWYLRLETGYGTYDTWRATVDFNSGVVGNHWTGYGRFSRLQSDGYRDWTWSKFWRYFIGLQYQSEKHSVILQSYGGPQKDGLGYYGIPKDYVKDQKLRKSNYGSGTDVEWFHQPHYEILHQWSISDRLTLNTALFYVRGYGYFDYDGSWGTPEYFRLIPEFGFSEIDSIPGDAIIRAYVDNSQYGILPRLSYRIRKLEIVGGVEFRRHTSLHWGRLQNGSGLPNEVAGEGSQHYYQYDGGKDITSLFVHSLWKATQRITVLTDFQVAFKSYRIENEWYLDNEFELKFDPFLNPRFGITYRFFSNLYGYVNLSRTTREPRLKNYYDAAEASYPQSWGYVKPQFEFNEQDSTYDFSQPLVKPETLWDTEVGFGYSTKSIFLQANLFRMGFENEIVKSGQLDRFGQPITGNARETLHLGVELSGIFAPSRTIEMRGNVTLSKNELVKYSVFEYDENWNPVEISYDGNPIAGFPDLMANGRLSYRWKEALLLSYDLKYVGKQYTDNTKDNSGSAGGRKVVDPYTNVDFTARFSPKMLEGAVVSLHINNVLNSLYATAGEGEDFFVNAPRNFFMSLSYEF